MVDKKGEGGDFLSKASENIGRFASASTRITYIVVLSIISLVPILFVLSVSFSKGGELYAGNILPSEFTLENYRILFSETDFLTWIKNSIYISGTTALVAVFITSLSAYVLSRYRFRGRETMTSTLLVIQLFPAVMSLVAIYKILQILKILDTHIALILVYLGGAIPFTTWLIKGFFDTVPKSTEEAYLLSSDAN